MADRYGPLGATRRDIIGLLRRGTLTVGQVADRLELTASAVRVHMRALEQMGLVKQAGLARGLNRPATIYGLAPGVDALLCGAYVPFVTKLLQTIGEERSATEVAALMHRAGRRLAMSYERPPGTLGQRAEAVSGILNDLGALTEVEAAPGRLPLRGFDCPLAAAVQDSPAVCCAMESFVAELVRAPVHECCDRSERPRCCFEILPTGRSERAMRKSPR